MQRDILEPHVLGDTWTVTWPDFEDAAGQPWVWTGTDEIHGQLRAGHPEGALLYEWTNPSTDVDLSVDGELTLRIPHAVTEAWTARRGVAHVRVMRAGERDTVISFVQPFEPSIIKTA